MFVSDNGGESWKKIKRPPYTIYELHFDQMDKGYALRLEPGAFKSTWEIYSYTSDVGDWFKEASAPFQCAPTRVSAAIPIFCVASDGSILGLHDGDWKVEFFAQ